MKLKKQEAQTEVQAGQQKQQAKVLDEKDLQEVTHDNNKEAAAMKFKGRPDPSLI